MLISVKHIPESLVRFLQRRLLAWGRNNFSDFPWRHENNLFHALVAEILLQRTRAEQVVSVYRQFVGKFPTPVDLAEATTCEVETLIAPLGLKWRARFLSELGKRLMEVDGVIPMDTESLQKFPGVGAYAAAAFLSLHGGKRVPIVDSNVVRFYGRFFGFNTGPETRRKKEILQLADRVTPARAFRDFNYGLIDFTRTICRPKPYHDACPLAHRCQLYHRLTASSSVRFGVENGIRKISSSPAVLHFVVLCKHPTETMQ